MSNESPGLLLRELRINRGCSLEELSKKVGEEELILSKIERGRLRPTEELLEKILKYFGEDKLYSELSKRFQKEEIITEKNKYKKDDIDIPALFKRRIVEW